MNNLVLNPRSTEQAEELNRLLRSAELTPLAVPTVEVVPGWTREQAQAIRDGLLDRRYAWVVVPSVNAARYLLQALEEVGGSSSDLLGTQILAGVATARVLAKRGVTGVRSLARFSAQVALELLLAEPFQGRVLLPRAAEGRDELLTGLEQNGYVVDSLVLYQTRPVDPSTLHVLAATFARGHIAAVLFTSPSTVRGLLDGLRALHFEPSKALGSSLLVCIGETTAEAVRAYGLTVHGVAERTNLGNLVEITAALLRARSSSAGDLVGGLTG